MKIMKLPKTISAIIILLFLQHYSYASQKSIPDVEENYTMKVYFKYNNDSVLPNAEPPTIKTANGTYKLKVVGVKDGFEFESNVSFDITNLRYNHGIPDLGIARSITVPSGALKSATVDAIINGSQYSSVGDMHNFHTRQPIVDSLHIHFRYDPDTRRYLLNVAPYYSH